jgi:DNA-damage-inducible protein D
MEDFAMSDLTRAPAYATTMERLESLKRVAVSGMEYWMAREIYQALGYPTWRGFDGVMQRAQDACSGAGYETARHFVRTSKMLKIGNDAERRVEDWFLSRAACYLIAMNGDPSKTEIAAAQAYFAAQTRRMEQEEALQRDSKRLELRDKVKGSVRRVSSEAQKAGVRNGNQGIFHEQRYIGLYEASSSQVKAAKGLKEGENIFDRFGPMELSTHDFQMNLAADAISNEGVLGEQAAFQKNLEVARHVRHTIKNSGGTLPEYHPLEEHIAEVRKRVTGKRTKVLPRPKPPTA